MARIGPRRKADELLPVLRAIRVVSTRWRAFLVGAMVAVCPVVAWAVALAFHKAPEWIVFAQWIAPAVGSMLCAYLAPSRNVLLAALVAVPSAVAALVLNWLYEVTGSGADFPGVAGNLLLFGWMLMWDGVLCVGGGVVGARLSRRKYGSTGV